MKKSDRAKTGTLLRLKAEALGIRFLIAVI
jgi:hypothetical protein